VNAPARMSGHSFRQHFQTGHAERRQIVRFSRRYQIAVPYYLGILPKRPGIHHIVFDREEGSCAFAAQHVGRTEYPRAVADGRHEFALFVEVADEVDRIDMPANKIGRKATGGDDAIEFAGLRLIPADIGSAGITDLAGINLTGYGAYGHDMRAGFPQAVEGIPDLHFLVLLVDKDCDSAALEVHREILQEVCVTSVTDLHNSRS